MSGNACNGGTLGSEIILFECLDYLPGLFTDSGVRLNATNTGQAEMVPTGHFRVVHYAF